LFSYLRNEEGPKSPFATALLPNVFGAPVYGRTQHIVNRDGGIILHIWHQTAVEIYRDAGVPWVLTTAMFR
jgi:hypothetical protein